MWTLRQDPQFFRRVDRVHSRIATLYFEPSVSQNLAVIVPKTVAPLAIDRNTLKRRVKEIVKNSMTLTRSQPLLHSLPNKATSLNHWTIVIALKKSVMLLNFSQLTQEIEYLLNQARLRN